MEGLVRRSLSNQIVDRLRERILSGEFAPETPIRQEALALELSVSKIPVREALVKLEQEGLVTLHPNRGFIVCGLSADEAEDVFDLRLKIEPDLAALAATSATPSQHAVARQALAALDAEVRAAGNAVESLNRAFHMSLVWPAARPLSIQLPERLHALSERYVRVHLKPKGRNERAEREHAALLETWLSGNVDAVRETTRAHIAATLADLREQLSGGE
jgi:DNA-binding GntR family transcriptional regulator